MSPAMSKNRLKNVMDSCKEPKKKRRVWINLIENRDELHTTFTKRRQGLFKMATEFCDKFAAQAVVITFSSSGSVYALGDPRFDPLLKRYLADPSSVAASNNGVNGGGIMVATLTETEKRISEALGKGLPAWDAETVNLGLCELEGMETAIRKMKSKVTMRERGDQSTELDFAIGFQLQIYANSFYVFVGWRLGIIIYADRINAYIKVYEKIESSILRQGIFRLVRKLNIM